MGSFSVPSGVPDELAEHPNIVAVIGEDGDVWFAKLTHPKEHLDASHEHEIHWFDVDKEQSAKSHAQVYHLARDKKGLPWTQDIPQDQVVHRLTAGKNASTIVIDKTAVDLIFEQAFL